MQRHVRIRRSELAESSSDEDEAGSFWSRARGTTSTAATATVAKSVGEVRPLGIAKCSAIDVYEILEAIKDIPPELISERDCSADPRVVTAGVRDSLATRGDTCCPRANRGEIRVTWLRE